MKKRRFGRDIKRRVGLAVVYSCSVLLAFELAGRVNFFSHHDLPFWTPASQFAYRFYPNIKPIMEDNRFDRVRVLVLAASALNRGWSDFEVQLRDRLSTMLGRDVYVFNSSMPARTSLDSYYKYWFLRHRPFDLVILYNSINELRANNVPDALWRDDYSHYAWYDEANFYFRHYDDLAQYGTILPFYLKHLEVALDRKFINRSRKVSYNAERTRSDWWRFGATVKSATTFRRNLDQTIALARAKSEPVLVMTYAYYLPADYSLERFQRGELGYGRSSVRGSEVEIWGLPDNIRKGLDIHNEVLRDVGQKEGTFFVDQQALLGNDPKNFIDVCHLSPIGMKKFVDHIILELQRRRFKMPGEPSPPEQREPDLRPPITSPSVIPTLPDMRQSLIGAPAEPRHPFMFGSQVVWQDFRDGERSGVYCYDLMTKREERILDSRGADEIFPRISGHRIITDVVGTRGQRDIYVYDQLTRQKQRLTGKYDVVEKPDISGDLAVWMGRRDGTATHETRYGIFLHDFATEKDVAIAAHPDYDNVTPAIDGNRVVWQSLRPGQSGIYFCAYDRETGTCPEHRIVADDGGATFLVGEPDVSGTLVVFSTIVVATHQKSIHLYNLATDRSQPLTTQPGFQDASSISGNRIVWQDRRHGVWDIYYCEYDPQTGRCPEQRVTSDPWAEQHPTIADDRIVWENYRNGHTDLSVYQLRR